MDDVARDRLIVLGTLGALALLCWAWIVPMAQDMYGSMSGPSAWMMTLRWDARHVLLLFAMWTVMMAGMMLPSALPTFLLYTRVVRNASPSTSIPLQVYSFAGGYLTSWTIFSAAATATQRLLSQGQWLSPMMELSNPRWSAALLVAAGAYQVSPIKRRCLVACQAPAAFIARHWRRGVPGAWRMGLTHGAYCVGCCWMLMLLLFAGGVMNLGVILTLAAVVLVEKLVPTGRASEFISGAVLAGLGLWIAVRT